MADDHGYNIRAFIEHAARFEMEAKCIESEIETVLKDEQLTYRKMRGLVPKRQRVWHLRHMADDAQHQSEILRKLDGEDTTIRRTGDLIAEEISRQEYLAVINVKCE